MILLKGTGGGHVIGGGVVSLSLYFINWNRIFLALQRVREGCDE